MVQQDEQAEEIVTRVKAEENKPRPEKLTRHMPEVSFQSKRKDTLATEKKSPTKPELTKGVVLQVSYTPTNSTPSRMSISIYCLSYSIRATD